MREKEQQIRLSHTVIHGIFSTGKRNISSYVFQHNPRIRWAVLCLLNLVNLNDSTSPKSRLGMYFSVSKRLRLADNSFATLLLPLKVAKGALGNRL